MILLIGHRGTGKTTFLRRLSGRCLDLDAEIEKANGPIAELFARGEKHFRECERTTFEKLHAQKPDVIALGAGFEGPLPKDARVVWLQRPSDFLGRSFLNRPRLDAKLSPLEEYRERFFERERRYSEWATEQLVLPEGYEGGLEKFLDQKMDFRYDVTLLPEDFRHWNTFLARRTARRWEIRDDILTDDQIQMALRDLPKERIIFSRRRPSGQSPADVALDWPLELGAEPPAKTSFISLHERGDDFQSALDRLSSYNLPLKLAIEVKDFTELKAGHAWYLQDPQRRSFLPRSAKGTWRWYRSLFGPRMPVHFVREGMGSSLDQPLFWQTVMQPEFKGAFAAVLGSPVEHSRSPQEHRELSMPFVAIDIPEEEFAVALKFLQEIGLKQAAVTAPLKKLAWANSSTLTSEARKTQAVNTLFHDRMGWVAHNTDVLALQTLSQELGSTPEVWLWGGGGIKSSVRQAWPKVAEISAREGTSQPGSPDLLIWATGRSRKFVFPSLQVKPKLVLDLNYSDDSPGLEWAVRENLPYQSGLRMFKLQAEFQREFWSACERGEGP